MSIGDLIKSILVTIKDYEMPLGVQMSYEHVERWASQFEKDDQAVILSEMNTIFKRFYFSRDDIKKRIRSVLSNKKIFSNNPIEKIKKTTFLNIQSSGQSQKDLLNIVDEILMEEYNIGIEDCCGEDVYFYIDDCVYTGNKYRYDLVPWIDKNDFKKGAKLISYHIAFHETGWSYAFKNIKEVADAKGLKFESWRYIDINNIKKHNSPIEVLWPMEDNDSLIVDYCNRVREVCKTNDWQPKLFRSQVNQMEEVLFTSSEARNIVEKAFLKVGSKLVMSAESPAQSMRPLGFEKLESLGFGSFFITYRNIANNCPLALWYGDPTFGKDHPFGLWYPLFPRVTQQNNDIFNVKTKEIEWEELFNER